VNKEQIYDAHIAPLMSQILAICKEHKIAMLASFAIPSDYDDDLCCSSALTTDEYDPPDAFRRAVACLYQPQPPPMHLTVRDEDGNVKEMHTILGM
jgi:hypothetical protein